LSPYVLRKEIARILEASGPELLCKEEFRRTSPSIFWNLTWHLSNYRLPIDFLLFHFSASLTNGNATTTVNGTTATTTTIVTSSSSVTISSAASPTSALSTTSSQTDSVMTSTTVAAMTAQALAAATASFASHPATGNHIHHLHSPHAPLTPAPATLPIVVTTTSTSTSSSVVPSASISSIPSPSVSGISHAHLTPTPPATPPPTNAMSSPTSASSTSSHYHPHPPPENPPVLSIAPHPLLPAAAAAAIASPVPIAFGGHASPVLGPPTLAVPVTFATLPGSSPIPKRGSFSVPLVLHPPASTTGGGGTSLATPSPPPTAHRLSFGAVHVPAKIASASSQSPSPSPAPSTSTNAAAAATTNGSGRPHITLVSVTRVPVVDTTVVNDDDSAPSSPDSAPITFYPLPDTSPNHASVTSVGSSSQNDNHERSERSNSLDDRTPPPIVLHLPTDGLHDTPSTVASLLSPSADDRVTLYAFDETPTATAQPS
jgi:hypothetical protein